MAVPKKILLTGGTGQLGQKLLQFLTDDDVYIDVLSRKIISSSTPSVNYIAADITKPDSLISLSNHYDIIIHCASNPLNSDTIDNKGTRNLLAAIKDKRIKNFIYISIVGVDKTIFPYYVNKRKAEQLIIQSGIPYTILRVTQFHDFVYNRILNIANNNTVLTFPSGLYFQSISVQDVCLHINKLVHCEALNVISEIGGPEICTIEEMAQTCRQLLMPGTPLKSFTELNDFQKLFTTGINLCPEQKTGAITWKEYILNKV